MKSSQPVIRSFRRATQCNKRISGSSPSPMTTWLPVSSAKATVTAIRLSPETPRCFSTTPATKASQIPATENLGSDALCDVVAAPNGAEGNVATITLSNPKRLNSLSRDTIRKLTGILRGLAAKSDLRCVVIQGGPTSTRSPSFTSGANIFEMADLSSFDEAKLFITELHECCEAMRIMPVPTIARIDGLCLGGGLELVSACDFRYATATSIFSMPETKVGIPSIIEARLLANIIGYQKAKEMCYFAKSYTAAQVEPWGLVDKSCADGAELDATVDQAVGIITSYGPKTMREQKYICRVWEEENLVTGIEKGVDSYARMFSDGGSEPKKYMAHFIQRKK